MEIVGRQIELGVGVEKVRGTAQETAEKYVKNTTANIIEKSEKVIDDSSHNKLEDSDGSRVTKKWIEGDLNGVLHADAIGYFLYNLYGAVVSSNVTGPVYSHVFNMLQSIEHAALSLFAKDGAVQQLVFNTCMLATLEINASVDDYVRYTASFMGKSGESNSDTPSYDTEYDFIGRDITVKIADTEGGLVAAEAVKIKDLTITYDVGLIVDHVLGDYNPDDLYNAKMAITGSFDKNFVDTTFKDLSLSDDAKYMEITIEGAADIGSGNNPSMTFLFNRVQIQSWDRSGDNDDLVTESIDFKAFYDETDDKQSQLTLQNLTTEYDTPVSD